MQKQGEVWQTPNLNAFKILSALEICTAVLLLYFLVTAISSASWFWATSATYDLNVVEYGLNIALILIHSIAIMVVQFSRPEMSQTSNMFVQGALIGFRFPLAMFLIGEASSWIWGTTMKSAGICCLSAIAAGQMQGGIFMYSHQFGEKAPKTNHQHWFSKQSLWIEGISIITLGAILILSAVCLIWQSVFLPANQAFALASSAFAYIGAFGYAVFLKLHLYSKEHLAMGALTGMMSAIGIIAARWCIRTASFANWSWFPITAITVQAVLTIAILSSVIRWCTIETNTRANGEDQRQDTLSVKDILEDVRVPS